MSETPTQTANDLVEKGRVLHRAGRLEEAEQLYARALALDEDCAEGHHLMAVMAGQRGDFNGAISGFRHTIALEGPTPDRLYNLAEAYRVAGDFDSALEAYTQVLTMDAAYLDAYRSCAAMAKDAAALAAEGGDAASADQLAKLAAHHLVGLGHACLRAQDVPAAAQAYRDSLDLDATRADAYNCLGAIALEGDRPIEAEALCRRAHALEPKSPLFINNVGRALLAQVRTDDAAAWFRQAIEVDPSFEEARTNLRDRLLAWLLYRADLNLGAIVAAHREWGRAALAEAPEIPAMPAILTTARDLDRPLRVGYVGVDTRASLTHSFLVPLLANHDRSAVRANLYMTAGSGTDKKQFAEIVDRFQPLVLRRAKETARIIRKAGIDVLVDVAGHLPHNRLDVFAVKPARVSATWLGYPATTGLTTVDYRITDDVVDPPGAEELYTERLFRIAGGAQVFRPAAEAGDVAMPPAGTPGAITFGNFDDPRKISPDTVSAWSKILRSLPAARLLLVGREFADAAFAAKIHADLTRVGIAAERVSLRHTPERADARLRGYAEVDIALDTFPFNGALTTVCEALWMGVPVIAIDGDRPSARTTMSVLAQVGLERLASHTADEYAETAIELAGDPVRLRSLRSGMRARMKVSPLMDERGFARRFEAALRDMWRRSLEATNWTG